VVLVVAHAGLILDEFPHPAGGPQPALVAQGLRAALERAFKRTQLGRAELRWTTGVARLA
jgi:hypothetical protein